jgi:hypothetical protein
MTPQTHAQTETVSPLTKDQDGDGDPINEEFNIEADCISDFNKGFGYNPDQLGYGEETTLSQDDCDFVMHYLSGQCEEQTAIGANVTQVCTQDLWVYLQIRDLFTKDFPTDEERFNELLDEYNQKVALAREEYAEREANTPSWAENLE